MIFLLLWNLINGKLINKTAFWMSTECFNDFAKFGFSVNFNIFYVYDYFINSIYAPNNIFQTSSNLWLLKLWNEAQFLNQTVK